MKHNVKHSKRVVGSPNSNKDRILGAPNNAKEWVIGQQIQ